MTQPLKGRTILLIEDEALIAMDIADTFQRAGATVLMASSLRLGRVLVEYEGISAAIIDHDLNDGNAEELCIRLNARCIPFVVHSGYIELEENAFADAPQVPKPACAGDLLAKVQDLLGCIS